MKKLFLFILITILSFTLISCTKDTNDRIDNVEFNALLDEAFLEFLGTDPLNVNYSLMYPEEYGITDLTVMPYSFLTSELQEDFLDLKDLKNRIIVFSDDTLSNSQILTKKILIDYIDRNLLLENFTGYDAILNSSLGYQLMLPFSLAEYRFDDLADINHYFDYLSTTKDTFENIISYESIRSNSNIGLTDTAIDKIITQCEDLINQEENYLIEVFNQKIDNLSFLTETEKTSLKAENLNLIETDFIDAYIYLKDALVSLKGVVTHNGAICNYLNGMDYYQASFQANIGSDLTIPELEDYLEVKLSRLLINYSLNQSKYNSKFSIDLMEGLEVDNLIEYFKTNMSDFPLLDIEIEYEVKEMYENMQDSVAAAMYLISPIDTNSKEYIYLNPTSLTDVNNTLFQTVAHESYPGHLFQHVYFKNTDAHDVRKIIDYTGYSEGWAKYIENEVVGMVDSSAKKAIEYMDTSSSIIICLLDIGIHYHGWDLSEATTFLNNYFQLETSQVEELYNSLLEIPLMYMEYFFTYFQIQDLKTNFKDKMGSDYSDLLFHTILLDIGPAPFSILEEVFENYK